MNNSENKKECPDCSSIMQFEEERLCHRYTCTRCGYIKIDTYFGNCCSSPNSIPTKHYFDQHDYYTDPNDYSIYKQCQSCGKKTGLPLKKNEHLDAPYFDYNLLADREKELKDLGEEKEKIKEARQAKNLEKHRKKYNEYLNSDQWKKIRKVVLKRDKNLCQSCLCNQAEEVHHTDTDYRYNEPIFSLVSLCKPCHKKITLMDEIHSSDGIEKITYEFDKD